MNIGADQKITAAAAQLRARQAESCGALEALERRGGEDGR
jgi:hypothetical protein